MTAHVAEGAGAESDAPAPFTGVIHRFLEGARPAHADPVVPGKGGGNGIDRRRQRLVVTPALVRERVDFLDLADDAAAHERLAVALRFARRDLDPHLRRQAAAARFLGEQTCFPERVAERLLYVDGLPQLHGFERDGAVHVIGDRDIHRIDVRALPPEHLPPVLVDPDLGEALLQRRHQAQIDVGHGDQLEGRMLRERLQVGERLAGRADTGMTKRGAAGSGRD